jgi:hypothetical protein
MACILDLPKTDDQRKVGRMKLDPSFDKITSERRKQITEETVCKCGNRMSQMKRLDPICTNIVDFFRCPCGKMFELRNNYTGVSSQKEEINRICPP